MRSDKEDARGGQEARRRLPHLLGRPGGFCDTVEHPRPGGAGSHGSFLEDGSGLQKTNRLRGTVLLGAEAARADRAPVRLRCPDCDWLPQNLRSRQGLQAEHRAQPHDARRPRIRARLADGLRLWYARVHRLQCRPALPRLGHGRVPLRPPAGAPQHAYRRPAGRHRARRQQLRLQAPSREHRPRGHVLGPHRGHGLLGSGASRRLQARPGRPHAEGPRRALRLLGDQPARQKGRQRAGDTRRGGGVRQACEGAHHAQWKAGVPRAAGQPLHLNWHYGPSSPFVAHSATHGVSN
mmetsp:Transcript_57754/g.167321  ORF Transcript_57754/g.167321 Transcript_57754/m.167321 type:complete len:294 (-) Transcript_57754:61-942(-)